MKKFIIEVPKGKTTCAQCPFWRNYDVCTYLSENKHCDNFNFESVHLWDSNNDRSFLEMENTEFDYGHNINHKTNE